MPPLARCIFVGGRDGALATGRDRRVFAPWLCVATGGRDDARRARRTLACRDGRPRTTMTRVQTHARAHKHTMETGVRCRW